MSPHSEVMCVKDVDIAAETPSAFFKRTHDAVVAVVENTLERFGGDEALPHTAQIRSVHWNQHSTCLRRDDDSLFSARLTEDCAEALFAQAEAVVRCAVEILDAVLDTAPGLARVRSNGWALAGLAEVYKRKGDTKEEALARQAYARAWLGGAAPDIARL